MPAVRPDASRSTAYRADFGNKHEFRLLAAAFCYDFGLPAAERHRDRLPVSIVGMRGAEWCSKVY
jgi:hypothetical protein